MWMLQVLFLNRKEQPDVSERTRMRDYEILNEIGYTIRWDEYEKRHIVQRHLYQIREEF